MIDHQNYNRPHDGNKHAVYIHAAHALRTEDGKQVAADHRPDNPQNDIQNQTLALLVDDFAGDKTSDKAKNNSAYNRHPALHLFCGSTMPLPRQ